MAEISSLWEDGRSIEGETLEAQPVIFDRYPPSRYVLLIGVWSSG